MSKNVGSKATQFKKGVPRHPAAGRKKGQPNRVTREIREAILAACNNLGFDLKGYGGLTGFFMRVGIKSPNTLAHLAGKLLSLKVEPKIEQGVDLSKLTDEEIIELHRLLAKGQIPLLQDPAESMMDGDMIDAELSPKNDEYIVRLHKLCNELDDEPKGDSVVKH